MTSPANTNKVSDVSDDVNHKTWSCRIYIVVTLFSISATLGLDALWVTSPVSSRHLPEGHRISTYLVCFILAGNIGSVAYLILRKCTNHRTVHEVVPIYGCLLISIVACGLLALFWDQQGVVEHREHSVAYLAAALCLAIVACVGNVTFVPFVSMMKASYITAVLMGEALAGIIPHLVAIGQGIGEPPNCPPEQVANRTWILSGWRVRLRPTTTQAPVIPPPLRFNESIYFFVMTGVLCIAGFCFLVLRCIPSVRFEYDYTDCASEVELRNGRRNPGIEDDNEELLNANMDHAIGHPVILDDGSIRHTTIRSSSSSVISSYKNSNINTIPQQQPPCDSIHQSHPYRSLFPQSFSESNATGVHLPASRSRNANPKRTLSPYRPPSVCLMLTFTLWACLVLNGPLSSVKAHSCIPLGNRAFQSGTLMTKIASIVAIIVTQRVNPYSRVTMVVAFTSLGTIVLTYFVALISFSHESDSREESPIFMNTGELLSVRIYAFLYYL